jgi:spore coat protein CotF
MSDVFIAGIFYYQLVKNSLWKELCHLSENILALVHSSDYYRPVNLANQIVTHLKRAESHGLQEFQRTLF